MDELDKLLESSWSQTVDVYISISYTKILDIDTINQRFQAEAIIESKWFDPNIKSLSDQIDEKTIWKPDFYIENGIKDVREEVIYRIVPYSTTSGDNSTIKKLINLPFIDTDELKIDEELFMICEIRKVTGVFYENLELQDFPLDVQDLTITVATKKPGKIVNIVPMQAERSNLKISNTLDKSMWKMHDVLLTQKSLIEREYSYGQRKYPAIKVSAKVFRLPGFFYWNALLPILLVSLASLAPFVVDIKIPQSRLPSTCTLMLTSVGIRWTIGRLLPTVSYLTSLDKYSLGTMMIITMELLYHAIMGAVFPKLNSDTAYALDKGFFVFFCFLILLKQILFIVWVIKVNLFRKKVRDGKLLMLNEELLASSPSISTVHSDNENNKKNIKRFSFLKKKVKTTKNNNNDDDDELQKENMIENDFKTPVLMVRV